MLHPCRKSRLTEKNCRNETDKVHSKAVGFDVLQQSRSMSSASFVSLVSMTFLLLLLHVSTVHAQDNFYFSITPESADVVEGRDVVLRCSVSKKSHIQYYWTLDGVILANTTRRYQHESNLYIQRVNHTEDSGVFHCIATNTSSGFSSKSSEAVLNILWLLSEAEVQLRQPSQPSQLNIGNEMKLRCYVSGNPEPTYLWFKNDISLTATSNLVIRDNQLIIRSLEATDSGVYSCQASNEAGFVASDKNFLLNLKDNDPSSVAFEVNKFKRTIIVEKSSTAYLDCVYTNVITTEWYFKSAKIGETSRIRIFTNGTLRISNVKDHDEGAYVCRGVGQTSSQEFSSRLLIAKLNDFTGDNFQPRQNPDRPFVIALGGSSKIKCFIPEGVPDPEFYWEDSAGHRVGGSGRIYVDDTTLMITNAGVRDGGQYSCVASNLSGKKRGNVLLVVSIPPVIIKHPEPVSVMEGAPASMQCSFSGSPYPVSRVLWYRDNDVLPDSKRYQIQSDQGTLYISKTEILDRGTYTCVINTTAQPIRASKPALMTIRRKLKFTAKPVSYKLLELDTISRLVCQAEAREDEAPPTIYWMPTNGSSLPANVVDKQGVLEFNPVKRTDKANYTCTASTASQGTINTSVTVDVIVRPKFQVRPRNTTAYEGFPIMLHCLAVGDPEPKIRWYRNAEDIELFDQTQRIQILHNGSLSVSQVYLEDKGLYACIAGNSGGLTRAEVFLDVASTDEYLQEKRRKQEEDQNMIKTVVIAVCSAVAYLGLVIGLTVYCSLRLIRSRRNTKQNENTEMADKCSEDLHEQQRNLIEDKSIRAATPSSSDRTASPVNFPRNDLQTLGMLGKGWFGDVFLARARGIKRPGQETQVLVKSLINSENNAHKMEFKRQMEMFRRAEHDNVVKLLAVCAEVEPHFMILEYCEWGDLKQFLRAMHRDNGRNVKVPPLTAWQKVVMCKQVSAGMEKLAALGFVHKDLATRNILLCPSLDVKISHLGLCRDVYAGEYYQIGGVLLPIRWMPPESLKEANIEARFTPKSDMWAFGVLCWEVFTLADIPYRHEADEDVIEDVQAGDLRPELPATCPQAIQTLLNRSCFCSMVEKRATFAEMTNSLSEFVQSEVEV